MKDFRQRAFVGLIGLVSAGLISIGCSSSSGSGGTGGSSGTGTGGSSSTGTGGSSSTGTGGSSSTGTGGASANACGPAGTGTTSPAPGDLITDFSDVSGDAGAKIMFGSTSGIPGGVVTFQNPASTAGSASVSSGALTYSATVSAAGTGADMYPYSGFVVYFNGPACLDASQYTGVQFSIKGDVGTCGLVFSFNDAEHGAPNADDPRAVGPAGSYSPQFSIASMVTSSAATVMVPFTGPTGGSPMSAPDPMNLTGVQWQFSNSSTATDPCMGSITVDDIKFYK
jgi:hypothetical protein